MLTISLILNIILIIKTIAQSIRINDFEWSIDQDRLDNNKNICHNHTKEQQYIGQRAKHR